MTKSLQRLVFYIGFFLLWQGIVALRFWPPYLFPGPLQVFTSLAEMVQDGSLWEGVIASFGRLMAGYVLAAAGGLGLGVLLSRSSFMENTVGSLALGLQTLPSICWLPLALIWFGLNERAVLFVIVMGAILSVAIAAESGIRHVPPVLVRAAQSMGASGFQLYRRVVLPAALPPLITGLKQGWSFAWRSLMAAELLYATQGLGYLLHAGRELNDVPRVLAVIVVIIFLGSVVDQLFFAPLERRVRQRWGVG